MHPLLRRLLRLGLAFVLLVPSAPVRAAPEVETFVLAVGGETRAVFPNPPPFACLTYMAAPPIQAFFGVHGPFMPVDGLEPCNIAGGFELQSAPSGPIADSALLDVDFANFNQNAFTGSADARAEHGLVGARSFGAFAGPASNLIVEGSAAFGKFRETFTITRPGIPNGSAGTLRMYFAIEGSLSVSGPPPFTSAGDVEVAYQQDSGPVYTLMRAQVTRSDLQPLLAVPTGFGTVFGPGEYGGFTLSAGTVSGSGEFATFPLSIVLGQPFDFALGVLAYSLPATGASVPVDFLGTARLSGIELLDAFSQPIDGFQIASGSGTLYSADGVAPQTDGTRSLARSGSPVPGGAGVFSAFPQGSSLRGARTAWLGVGTRGQGVYHCDLATPGNPCVPVADLQMAIPDGSGPFAGFGEVALAGQQTLFVGAGAGQGGIYAWDRSIPVDPVRPIADFSTEIPGGSGTFSGFAKVAASESLAGFLASGSDQSGAYVCELEQPGDPCRRLADLASEIPGGSGTFTEFTDLALAGLLASFVGGGAEQEGVYLCDATQPGDPCRELVDLASEIPGGSGAFTGFGELALDGTSASFVGSGEAQQGVYACDVGQPGDPCREIADLDTAVPGGAGNFTGFSGVATSQDHTAFLGQGSGGQLGVYLASALRKVVAVGDRIEGRLVSDLRLARDGFDGTRLSVAVSFADGSQAVLAFPVLDADGDGLSDDSDDCPFFAQTAQGDVDLDGRGNQCECTDQTGDGQNTVADLVAINVAIFNPSLATPLCDGNGDGQCNVADIVAANIEIFSPTNTSICARQPVQGP
jgi:hypothetical protein